MISSHFISTSFSFVSLLWLPITNYFYLYSHQFVCGNLIQPWHPLHPHPLTTPPCRIHSIALLSVGDWSDVDEFVMILPRHWNTCHPPKLWLARLVIPAEPPSLPRSIKSRNLVSDFGSRVIHSADFLASPNFFSHENQTEVTTNYWPMKRCKSFTSGICTSFEEKLAKSV